MGEAVVVGVNVVAGVITVLQLTSALVSTCYEYQSAIRSASKDMENIQNQLISLRDVLERLVAILQVEMTNADHLQNQVTGSGRLSPIIKLLNNPSGPLRTLQSELNILQKQLTPAKSIWQARLKALVWPLKEGQVRKVIAVLDSTKARIHLAMTAEQRIFTRTVPDVVISDSGQNIEDQNAIVKKLGTLYLSSDTVEDDRLLRKIHKWLSPPNPSSNHNDACAVRQAGTGVWFISQERFLDWIEQPGSFLWLCGMRCGKTVLSSTIIQEVSIYCADDPSLAVGYFYFDFNDEKKQNVENLLRSLVTQFTAQCPGGIPESLAVLYTQHDGERQPNAKALKRTLKGILTTFSHAYIIIDALDECTDRARILSLIEDMTELSFGHLHTLVTSRREESIEEYLTPLVTDFIDLEPGVIDPDIALYVCDQLRTDRQLSRWVPEIKLEIEIDLMNGAHGVFRWVACQLEVLRKCLTVDALRKVLKCLPRTLDETYHRILLEIGEECKQDAYKILSLLAFSARPVGLLEAAEVLAVDFIASYPHFNPRLRLREPRDILSICSSLVNISSSITWDGTEYEILRISHLSVKEYLTSDRIRASAVSWWALNKKLADTFIAKVCLAYLQQFDKPQFLDDTISLYHPLALYAGRYWSLHAHSGGDSVVEGIDKLILELFRPPTTAQYTNWICISDPDVHWTDLGLTKPSKAIAAPLYYASLLGLTTVSQQLIMEYAADVNVIGGEYGNPLQAASTSGHTALVQLLLLHGADVQKQSWQYGTPLQAASQRGYSEIVQLLLDARADPNAKAWVNGNALVAASFHGHKKVVELLLDRGATIDTLGWVNGTALMAASYEGREAVVRLLLDRGADVNVHGGGYGTALRAASLAGQEAIVRMLIKAGADLDADGGAHGNSLHVACNSRYEVIVRWLLVAGADIHALTSRNGTVLQQAAQGGSEAVVRLLLQHGANVNARGSDEETPLQTAVTNGNIAAVHLLLDGGADVNARGGSLGTPMQVAASLGDELMVLLMLEKGADVNLQGGVFGNALSAAAFEGHVAMVTLLLESGADINIQGGAHENALQAASKGGHEEVVCILLEAGADTNPHGDLRENALQVASEGGHQGVVQLLLEYGADVNAQGGDHRHALVAASYFGHTGIVKLLLDCGADADASGGDYGNALQAASLEGHTEIVRLLLDKGADVNAPGGNYGNALRAAKNAEIVCLLLDRGARASEKGATPRNSAPNSPRSQRYQRSRSLSRPRTPKVA